MNFYEAPGFRPITSLLLDPEISEIMINGPNALFIERRGVIQQIAPVFASATQLDTLVDNLVVMSGRAVNTHSPFADMRLPDGSRVNIALAPAALNGPVITIRKPTRSIQALDDLISRRTLTPNMARFLCAAVQARLNVVFSGGSATGKTTTLALLGEYIDPGERIVVIEDTAEIELRQPNVVRLEGRPARQEGPAAITLKELVVNSLRMRPTRIIVGEVRGEEAFDVVNAMSTGHDGCLAVVHASSPAHAIARLEMLMMSRNQALPMWVIHRYLAGAIHLIVQHEQLADGVRRITSIAAVGGVRDDFVELLPLFEFDPDAEDGYGGFGSFCATGIEPPFVDRMSRAARADVAALLR